MRFLSCLGALGTLPGVVAGMPGAAQSQPLATLSGTITDPSGAILRGASASLRLPSAKDEVEVQRVTTDGTGVFRITVAPGRYLLAVQVPGFAPFTSRLLDLKPDAHLRLPVRLTIASLHQEISVLDDQANESDHGDDTASAIVFEGDKLGLLSNDRATFQQQLNAMAGGAGVAHVFVDGFSGAQLPPKSSIRSIRINQNPLSAAFSEFGAGRVEISTKPGTDHLHGHTAFSGTERSLDARNPYTGVQPPFYDFQQDGNLNGPINRKTSFFVADTVEQLANNAVVNAANPAMPAATISTAVATPQLSQTYSLRVDRQLTERNFGYVRDEWSQLHVINSGIAALVLASAAYSANTLTNALQAADTQAFGAHSVNEARFQYLRTRIEQKPNSTLPSVIVQGAFQAGGSPGQLLQDKQDAFEFQDLFDTERGAHALRAGFRFRLLRDANQSLAGYNGQYTFPDVASYLAGRASQYSQTVGTPRALLLNDDLGVYAEDDWKLRSNFTLTYGLRFESQSAIPDHSDPAPRVSFAWAITPGKRKSPLVVLRGGYGLFYDRFPAAQLLQAIRQNGSRQVAYIAQDTAFDPSGPPPGLALQAAQPTVYRVSPALRSSYAQSATFTAEVPLSHFGTVSANLQYQHETHNFLSRNLNAPLPGTVDPANPGSGLRPLGTLNLYQFSSDVNGNLERFYLNYHLQVSRRFFTFGVFDADKHLNEVDGIDRFPSNEYDVRQDYGRAANNYAQQFTGGFQWLLPLGVTMTPFLFAHTGGPVNITTGTDLNGDTIFNDRPGIVADATRPSVVRTGYGQFDVAPALGQRTLPRSYGTAPGLVWLQVQASRDFHLGPRPTAQAAASASDGQTGGNTERPWVLNLAVEVHNLTNHNNPGPPVGVLSAQPCGTANSAACTCPSEAAGTCTLVPSQYFGHSLSLASDFSPITASNRTILLQTTFTW